MNSHAISSAVNIGCCTAPVGGAGGVAGGATGGFGGMGALLPAGGGMPWSTRATGGCVIEVVGVQIAWQSGNAIGTAGLMFSKLSPRLAIDRWSSEGD